MPQSSTSITPSQSTLLLRGLIENTTQNYSSEGVSSWALDAIALCLSANPDLSGTPATSTHPAQSLLALSIHRPQAALLLLDAGAPIEQDIVNALVQSHDIPHEGPIRDAHVEMAKRIAQAAPQLDWYALTQNVPGGFYDEIPCALKIEINAPGFNCALEAAQMGKGLLVGRIPRLTSRQEREEALMDLVSSVPDLFYLGETPRVEVLRALMKDDISPNLAVGNEVTSISLLESIISNCYEPDLVQELLDRGANIEPICIMEACLDIKGLNLSAQAARAEVLFLLLRHPRTDLDAMVAVVEFSEFKGQSVIHKSIPLREYVRKENPFALAQIEQLEINQATQPATRRPGSIGRL